MTAGQITADFDFIDTGFDTVSNLDFLVMHKPLLESRTSIDYHFKSVEDFVAELPDSIFTYVNYVAVPRCLGMDANSCDSFTQGMVPYKGKMYAKAWQLLFMVGFDMREEYDAYDRRGKESLYSDISDSEI